MARAAKTMGIESAWAVLKRGLNGTFHQVSHKYLHCYVDEFAFRLNDGSCEFDTIDRMEAVASGMACKRLAYKDLTK